ncbi:Uncharacterised protein [Mycobacteroides abscessus subsp. abscessus]|nr:Uncharacterised protein [Mycobacteroides abscessus subsp. abscessus]
MASAKASTSSNGMPMKPATTPIARWWLYSVTKLIRSRPASRSTKVSASSLIIALAWTIRLGRNPLSRIGRIRSWLADQVRLRLPSTR